MFDKKVNAVFNACMGHDPKSPVRASALDRATRHAGGAAKLARELQVTPAAITNWKTRGVPISHCVAIERASMGSVTRRDLRPDDWHLIWPELIGSEGAPAVPARALPQLGPAEQPAAQPAVAREGA